MTRRGQRRAVTRVKFSDLELAYLARLHAVRAIQSCSRP
jgi:hypothetical protein